jgi:hypothetical protein
MEGVEEIARTLSVVSVTLHLRDPNLLLLDVPRGPLHMPLGRCDVFEDESLFQHGVPPLFEAGARSVSQPPTPGRCR